MESRSIMIALALLILLPQTLQPCLGQAGDQGGANHTQNDAAKYDAPENDIGLFSSECSFRINAARKVMPEFPEETLKAGAQGTVVLSLYHDAEGNAAKIKLVESPHPSLTRAAIKAVKQWKWRLFMSGEIDRPVLSKLSFKFIIEDEVGRVEDAVNDCDKSRVHWSLSDIHALRLRATRPDDSTSNEP